MDWIGVPGLDPSWVPPACYKEFVINDPSGKQVRALIIEPPNFCLHITPGQYQNAKGNPNLDKNREIIERYEAQIDLLKWLRTTCMNKMVIQTTDAVLLMAREAGWSPDELVLTVQTGGDIVNSRWYLVDENATEYWYRKRYDCGLVRSGENWYRIPGFLQRRPGDSPEQVKQKYDYLQALEDGSIEETALIFWRFPRANEEEIRKCTEKLLINFLRYVYEKLWRTDKVVPFYSIFMDEPWKQGSLENPQFKGVVRGLYEAIRHGRENGVSCFTGIGYNTYFGVGGYDSLTTDVADVAGLGDYIFNTKYESDFYIDDYGFPHLGTDDQTRDWFYWRDHEPELFRSMRGSWLHLIDDADEISVLIDSALKLGWRDLYVFPGPDNSYWIPNFGENWRGACSRFRELVTAFCREIDKTEWIEHPTLRYGYLYCIHYPNCHECVPERTEDWTSERPAGFPVIDRGPARYLPGSEPSEFIAGGIRFFGESDR